MSELQFAHDDDGFRIGIDVGGTFTDFYCHQPEGGAQSCKTPTTHYDLSQGFIRGIGQLAKTYGRTLESFLPKVQSIRYSTTVGTNALIERSGPKLGLITTAGFEDTIYIGRARSWADGIGFREGRDQARIRKAEPLITPDMVVGVRERVDYSGRVLAPLNEQEVRAKLQTLVDQGAQGFVVGLLWSFQNPEHERRIKEIIESEYPEDYLGSMPVFLSSDITPKSGEYARFMTTIVNAYIHGVMADALTKLGNELRERRFKKPLTLVHNTGGTKKASRTRAVLTHNAGPVAGLHGAALLGESTGDRNIVFTDMGGTSFDIGLIESGEIKTHDFIPVIDRWRTNIPAIEVKSIGAGGGSIAWINTLMDNAIEVGPQSAGAMPGPACYDQGGKLPTVTDADLVLGLYNPENYLGGEMFLDEDLAKAAIQEHIAGPLGIDVVEAAFRIRRIVDARMGQEVFNEVALKGHDPRTFSVLACGGAGGAHACGIAPFIGAKRILTPSQSSVFGAFGASKMDVKEIWTRSKSIKFFNFAEQAYLSDLEQFNAVVEDLKTSALADLALEGFQPADITLSLELNVRYGSQYNMTKVTAPKLTLSGAGDVKALCEIFERQYATIYSAEATYPAGGVNVEEFMLSASVADGAAASGLDREAPSSAGEWRAASTRKVYWSIERGFEETKIYKFKDRVAGCRIQGPAIIETPETTYVVAPGWSFEMDGQANGVMQFEE